MKAQKKHDDIFAIGGYVDVEGLSIIRFDMVDGHYKIFNSYTIPQMPTYDEILSRISELAEIGVEDSRVDRFSIHSNFNPSLIYYLRNNFNVHPSHHIVRNELDLGLEDSILNLFNILNQDRLTVDENEYVVINALAQLRKIDRRKMMDIYQGNDTLNHVLYSVLHSIAHLEAGLIRMSLRKPTSSPKLMI